jgi:hypothetical protein
MQPEIKTLRKETRWQAVTDVACRQPNARIVAAVYAARHEIKNAVVRSCIRLRCTIRRILITPSKNELEKMGGGFEVTDFGAVPAEWETIIYRADCMRCSCTKAQHNKPQYLPVHFQHWLPNAGYLLDNRPQPGGYGCQI